MPLPGSAAGPRRAAGRDALVALAAGVLHTAAFAPVDAWWLQVGALALLAWQLRAASPRRAALLGLAFGFGWLASGLWWLYISMHRYGGIAAPLAAAAVALLSAALSLYLALAMAAFARWRHGRPATDTALFAACWLAAELARAVCFTGFPWLASGYAHTDGPLAAWAPWIGVYGIGALAAATAAALAGLLAEPRRRGARGVALALGAVLLLGSLLPREFTRSSGRLTVSLVQPNVAQELKFDSSRVDDNLERLAQAVESARGALVVTPESVVPLPMTSIDPAFWRRLRLAVDAPGRALLLGIFLGDDRVGYVNSMVALSATSGPGEPDFYHYGKRHLLPFGEFIPPGFHWFVRAMAIPLDDQERGDVRASFVLGGQRLRPLICYEDLFGEDFVDSTDGPGAATVYVNASNLAWFGTVMVQDQHLQFSRMRALEFQRPVVRSTNTGATAAVDHRGRVTARLPPTTMGTLEAEVEGRLGQTPYARWLGAAGLWPLAALAAGTIALAGATRRRWPEEAGR